MDIRIDFVHVAFFLALVLWLVTTVFYWRANNRLYGNRSTRQKEKNGYSTANEVECCNCGKLYTPLNDPDYIPELNLCRDCLWKLHYRSTFENGNMRTMR